MSRTAFTTPQGQRLAIDPDSASAVLEVPAVVDAKGKETSPAKFVFYIDGGAHEVLAPADAKFEDVADVEPPKKPPATSSNK